MFPVQCFAYFLCLLTPEHHLQIRLLKVYSWTSTLDFFYSWYFQFGVALISFIYSTQNAHGPSKPPRRCNSERLNERPTRLILAFVFFFFYSWCFHLGVRLIPIVHPVQNVTSSYAFWRSDHSSFSCLFDSWCIVTDHIRLFVHSVWTKKVLLTFLQIDIPRLL